jgi:hypothetical protein
MKCYNTCLSYLPLQNPLNLFCFTISPCTLFHTCLHACSIWGGTWLLMLLLYGVINLAAIFFQSPDWCFAAFEGTQTPTWSLLSFFSHCSAANGKFLIQMWVVVAWMCKSCRWSINLAHHIFPRFCELSSLSWTFGEQTFSLQNILLILHNCGPNSKIWIYV